MWTVIARFRNWPISFYRCKPDLPPNPDFQRPPEDVNVVLENRLNAVHSRSLRASIELTTRELERCEFECRSRGGGEEFVRILVMVEWMHGRTKLAFP